MAGIRNTTARPFSFKAVSKGKMLSVRVGPGFNVIKDEYWTAIKGTTMVKRLLDAGMLLAGKREQQDELDTDPDSKLASSEKQLPLSYMKGAGSDE